MTKFIKIFHVCKDCFLESIGVRDRIVLGFIPRGDSEFFLVSSFFFWSYAMHARDKTKKYISQALFMWTCTVEKASDRKVYISFTFASFLILNSLELYEILESQIFFRSGASLLRRYAFYDTIARISTSVSCSLPLSCLFFLLSSRRRGSINSRSYMTENA